MRINSALEEGVFVVFVVFAAAAVEEEDAWQTPSLLKV
jgi:hypothetical protein